MKSSMADNSSQEEEFLTATIIPSLDAPYHDKFGGPHTQYVSPCYYTHPNNGSLVPANVIVTCTQMYLCDSECYVLRVMLIERLLAVYSRNTSTSTYPASNGAEQELLLIFNGEHDLLIKGELICAGSPPKRFLATLMALFRSHSPASPVAFHPNCPAPLREVAKLRPLPGYMAPLPSKEERFENCPCWRQADVLNISVEEFTTRVRNMFIVYDPARLEEVHDFVRKYGKKKKGGAIQFLVSKYGPEPSEEHTASVLKVLEREKKFSTILAASGTATAEGPGGRLGVPLTAVMATQRRNKDALFGNVQPLYFSTVLLTNQPSGGYGRLHIRLRPLPYLQLQQGSITAFKRRPLAQEHEFWYLCNEGHVLNFDISPENLAPFCYRHGDRVLSTWGVTRGRWSTIIGVRDGSLWVHDDGDIGASSLVGFKNRDELERCNGWIKHENMANRLLESDKLFVMTSDGSPRWIHIAPEVVFRRFGFYHGDVVSMGCPPTSCAVPFDGVAVVVGVLIEDETALYVFFVDPSSHQESLQMVPRASTRKMSIVGGGGVQAASVRIVPSRAAAQPIQPRCMTPLDIQKQYGWKAVGIAKVLQYVAPPQHGEVKEQSTVAVIFS